MSSRNRGGRNYAHRNNKGKEQSKNAVGVDEENPLIISFRQFALELDDKHDRQERIVKLSRDITIESKRIIFLLHSIDSRRGNREKVLEEASQRLQKVIDVNFKAVAKELLGHDVYQYRHAYSPGLQEFIEAYTFMEFLKSSDSTEGEDGDNFSDWNVLQRKMQYADKVMIPNKDEDAGTETEPPEKEPKSETVKYEFKVDPHEYILGLSDLTGELMRRCINSLGSGETDACMETCKALQQFYTGYMSLSLQRSRELSRKIYTMRQSVLKAENVCYNVKVRGSEAAKWGAVFSDNKPNEDIDEGFF